MTTSVGSTERTPLQAKEYLYFVHRAFDGMLGALAELGDEHINTRPDLPGANSPYAIVYHCTGVTEYWIGHLLAGRPVDRDRAAEFVATGSVERIGSIVSAALDRLTEYLTTSPLSGALDRVPDGDYEGPDEQLSRLGVLLHVLEELAQHHGQVQLSRDLILRGATR